MIIVLDTNVFVGACLGTGAANRLLAARLRDEHTPLMGIALLMEYEDVLGRADLFAKCRLAASAREELFDIFLDHRRGTSVNRLIDEMTTLMLAEFVAETRFLLRAKRGRAPHRAWARIAAQSRQEAAGRIVTSPRYRRRGKSRCGQSNQGTAG